MVLCQAACFEGLAVEYAIEHVVPAKAHYCPE